MPVKIGVVGIGVHGLHHVRLLSSMGDADLVGVFDVDPAVGERAAAEFGCANFDSPDQLLETADCVTVAVPTTAHRDVVLHCLEAGKPVLVEKPIASTLVEADEMIAEADNRGLILSVGHLERFNAAYRSVTAEGRMNPGFIESHRLSVYNPRGTDVAVVLDLMIHDIDIVLDMVGRPVSSVRAVGIPVVTEEADIANARIEFEGGCVANLTASRISQKKMRKLRTFQKDSYISMDFLAGESEVFIRKHGARQPLSAGTLPQVMDGISYRKHPNDGRNALELELLDFIGAIRDGGAPRVTGRDGRMALEVATMIMQAMETRKP